MSEQERITELEIRFSHQGNFIDQLNQIVVEQQTRIERLEKEILDLKRSSLGESGSVSGQRSLKDDVPPHY